VQGWPGEQSGQVRFRRNATINNVVGEFPVAATGSLNYQLATPEGLIAYTPNPGITISPPDARYQLIIAITTRLGSDPSETGELRLGNRLITSDAPLRAGDKLVQLWYVDQDVTLTGSAEGCTYNQRFKAGWNYSVTEVLSTEPYRCNQTSSPTLPAGIGWYYIFLGI
jgi:hypothetical protein